MYPFLIYSIKAALSLAAFYLFYKLLCSRDTLHHFNRRLLLCILALSAVIPFMYIDLGGIANEASVIYEEFIMPIDTETTTTVSQEVAPTLWQRIPWQQIPWRELLAGFYLIGLIVCIARFVASLASIALLIKRNKCRELHDGTILVTHDKAYGPFSWMRYIIASEQDLSENFDMILAHERAHIRLHHSWDLLFAQLCAMVQWFNPAAWLLKRELEAIHEYEADSATLHERFDARQYQLRLFEEATGVKFNTITNNFNNCSTKKRIIMMMKRQTSPWARMKALFVIPVALAAVTVISCTSPKEKKVDNQLSNVMVSGDNPLLVFTFEDSTEAHIQGKHLNPDGNPHFDYLKVCGLTSENIERISALQSEEAKPLFGEAGANGAIHFHVKGKTADDMTSALAEYAKSRGNGNPLRISIKKPASIDEIQVVGYGSSSKGDKGAKEESEIYQVVEEQPMYPGGMQELMKYIQTNIRYPKEAAEKGIGGRVIVQFVVNKDGSISEENVVRSVDPQLDAEAIRIVRNMPNWTPGKQRGEPVRVRFTLPIAFAAGGNNSSGTPTTVTTFAAKETTSPATSTTGEEIFNVVEQMPEYPGGMEELMKFLQRNAKYPKEAQEQGKQGRVIVQFVVNKDGSITDAKIVRSVDPQLDAEALRVVNAMPNWTPGKQRGKEVRTYFTIPVTFRLSN